MKIFRNSGLTRDQYMKHVAEFGGTCVKGSPLRRFSTQKTSAMRRGIEWNFTFAEWWRVWLESGKWELCGRGDGYVMARNGDVGPYAPWNVRICTQIENGEEAYKVCLEKGTYKQSPGKPLGCGKGWTFDRRLKSRPYIAQAMGKQIGTYATPEEARAAYLEYCKAVATK